MVMMALDKKKIPENLEIFGQNYCTAEGFKRSKAFLQDIDFQVILKL